MKEAGVEIGEAEEEEKTWNGVWEETGGEKEYLEREMREERERNRIIRGLARCSVCGAEARVETFGLEGQGVWIGCNETKECVRNIEYHAEGWSLAEVAREWNRYNRGWRKGLRWIKRKIRKRFGEEERYVRRLERERREAEKKEWERRREVFGIKEERKGVIARIFRGKRGRKAGKMHMFQGERR